MLKTARIWIALAAIVVLIAVSIVIISNEGGSPLQTALNTQTPAASSSAMEGEVKISVIKLQADEDLPVGEAKSLSIEGNALKNVFTLGEETCFTVSIEFSAEKALDVDFSLINTFGEQTALKGSARIEKGEYGFEVRFNGLEAGHYMFTADANAVGVRSASEYAAVVPNESDRDNTSDAFGVDFASLWHTSRSERGAYLELIKKLGVNKVRERISLSAIYNPNGEPRMNNYIDAIEEIKHAGMDVIIVFHDIPEALKGDPSKTLDCDLFALYELLKSAVEALGDDITAWELWNEQDVIFFSYAPPDEFAAFAKACALAVQDSGVNAYKALGAYARGPYDSIYGEWMMQNDIMEYHDIYNFHSYIFAQDLYTPIFLDEQVVSEHMDNAKKYAEGKAVWQTETGVMMYGGETDDRPMSGLYQQARYVAVSSVLSAAMGVERTYQYIMIPLGQGGDSLSFISNYGTPYPAFCAYSTMTYMLGQTKFTGKIKPDVCNGFVFDSGNGEVSMLWTSSGTKEIVLTTEVPLKVYTMMGDMEILSPQNGTVTVTVSSYPCYVQGEMDSDLYDSFSPSVNKASVHDISEENRIVLRPIFPDANLPFFPDRGSVKENYEGIQTGYQLSSGESIKVQLEIYNFTDQIQTGMVTLNVAEGFGVDKEFFEVEIQGYSKEVIEFELFETCAAAQELYELSFNAVFNGEQASACVSKLQLRQ